MKRNNIIMALTLTSLALLFSETECGCHVMETIKEKMYDIEILLYFVYNANKSLKKISTI